MEDLDSKVQYIKSIQSPVDTNVKELMEFFKDKFNYNIVKVGDHATYDFNALFRIAPGTRKRFKNDPVQPITVTYIRKDVIFFTWDKHPEFGEEYTMYEADWSKWLYPREIKLSELWKNKEYLREKDYDEWYVQTRSLEFTSKYTKIVDDLDK